MDYSVSPNPDVPFKIRWQDDTLLVVEKPGRVVTQPGKKHEHDSLLNGLFHAHGNALQNMGESRGFGLLHRLDKDTSGLVLVALRPRTYAGLREQFEQRRIKKRYWALVNGLPRPAQGVIQKPIAEVVSTRKRAVLRRDGKPSITAYKVLEEKGGIALIEARPKTGRLHQIRVHMADLGCPVLGDFMYAGDIPMPDVLRLCLHAAELSFVHPETMERITVRAEWPQDLRKTLSRFGLSEPTF